MNQVYPDPRLSVEQNVFNHVNRAGILEGRGIYTHTTRTPNVVRLKERPNQVLVEELDTIPDADTDFYYRMESDFFNTDTSFYYESDTLPRDDY